MKIRVEFPPYEGDDAQDMESSFDVVEVTTVHAGSYEDWAVAVWDFVGTAGTRWDHTRIIQEALLVDGGWNVKDWGKFVELLSDKAKAELRAALDSST